MINVAYSASRPLGLTLALVLSTTACDDNKLGMGPPPMSAACVELGQADIWAPSSTSVSLPQDLGRVVGCVHIGTISKDQASMDNYFTSHNLTADNGYESYAIQYISQAPVGHLRRVTALLYLPSGGKTPYPVVGVNHGTSGLGPSCGVTHMPIYSDYMAVPLAARGYAVVATDYFGMGVDDGVGPYGVGEGEALSILDGMRALRTFSDGTRFDKSMLDGGNFVLGHSQGGHATLFAHQDWDSSLGPLYGSVTFAPGLGDLRDINQVMYGSRTTDQLTLFLLMTLYANSYYHNGPDASTWLSATAQAELPSALHDQCFAALSVSVPYTWPTQGDLFSASFLSAASGCDFRSSCSGFEPWYDDLSADIPGNFHSDVPALLVQGEKDTTVPPANTACVAQRLMQKGTPVETCAYGSSDHLSIVNDGMTDALTWMAARRQGQTPNVCKAQLAEACPQ